MWFYEIMLCVCMGFAYVTWRGLAVARADRQIQAAAMLRLLSHGNALCGISYLFRIVDHSRHGPILLLAEATCIVGSVCLWAGWLRLPAATAERAHRSATQHNDVLSSDLEASSIVFRLGVDSSHKPLSKLACRVLVQAHAQAQFLGDPTIDTDHILSGIMREQCGVGRRIVHLLVQEANDLRIFSEGPATLSTYAVGSPAIGSDRTTDLLSGHARRALSFAEQEANRFDSDHIGTEHLLLGVLLTGSGEGTIALFQRGVTVDEVRKHVLRLRSVARVIG